MVQNKLYKNIRFTDVQVNKIDHWDKLTLPLGQYDPMQWDNMTQPIPETYYRDLPQRFPTDIYIGQV